MAGKFQNSAMTAMQAVKIYNGKCGSLRQILQAVDPVIELHCHQAAMVSDESNTSKSGMGSESLGSRFSSVQPGNTAALVGIIAGGICTTNPEIHSARIPP